MKVFKVLALLSVVAGLSACGSSSAPIVGMNPYTGVNPYGTQTGAGTIAVPGGTKSITPIVYGTIQVSGTQNLPQTIQVQAGDQIIVNANGAQVTGNKISSILGGVIPTNSQESGYMSALQVAVNGQILGTGTSAQYTVAQSGTVSLAFDWQPLISMGTSNVNFAVSFNSAQSVYTGGGLLYGGVYLGRCTSTAGQAMNCPAGY